MLKKLFFILFFCVFFTVNAAVDLGESEPAPSNNNAPQKAPEVKAAQSEVSKRLKLAENNPVAGLLCKAIKAFTGTIAKVIAVLMVIGLALNLFAANTMNPVSPVTIVSVIIAVGMLFSADYIVGKVIGDAGKGGASSCDCKYGVSCEKL
jgi:type IV secretory pathway VirB2 component (pilin)